MTVHDQSNDSTGDAREPGPPGEHLPGPGAEVRNTVAEAVVSGTVVQAGTIGAVQVHRPSTPLGRPVPRQLPPAPHGFVGRIDHLADLNRRAHTTVPDTASDGQQSARMVVISAIGGTGGFGKT